MNRNQRKQIAEQTLTIIERGGYDMAGRRVDLAGDIARAVGEARLLRPDELGRMARQPVECRRYETAISVTNETTLNAGRRLTSTTEDGAILALNFASAKNPGGGFLGGSQAQEESLARTSALYPTLLACQDYYDINRSCDSAIYTDHMIYSPCVPVFRDDRDRLLPEPYLLSMLTAPAANAGAVRKNTPKDADRIEEVMHRRIGYVLHAAASLGHDDLVLGAWGCGVFRNDPAQIAGLFAEQLQQGGAFDGVFKTINFAVLDSTPDRRIIGPFEQALAEL